MNADGGLTKEKAAAMGMKANQLPTMNLRAQGEKKAATAANTGVDEMTLNHVRNWMECVRSRKRPMHLSEPATTTASPCAWSRRLWIPVVGRCSTPRNDAWSPPNDTTIRSTSVLKLASVSGACWGAGLAGAPAALGKDQPSKGAVKPPRAPEKGTATKSKKAAKEKGLGGQCFEISLAQWSLHRALKAGAFTNLDFPEISKKRFGIDAVEYVNRFFDFFGKDAKSADQNT